MKKIIIFLYLKLPKPLQKKLGKLFLIKKIRNLFLRNKEGLYRECGVKIDKIFNGECVKFNFFASLKTAGIAKRNGIETTLLNNTMILNNKYNSKRMDCVVFDIGANFGYLSLVWSKTIAKKGQVFSFEPNKNVYNSFQKSIEQSSLKERIRLENLAVGAEIGTIKLNMSNITSNVLELKNSSNTTMIEMCTIDSYFESNKIEKCDLIKIDVDGIELDILKGGLQTLRRFKPIYVVETNNEKAIIDFFINQNYTIFDMNLKEFDSNLPLPHNIFCVHNVL